MLPIEILEAFEDELTLASAPRPLDAMQPIRLLNSAIGALAEKTHCTKHDTVFQVDPYVRTGRFSDSELGTNTINIVDTTNLSSSFGDSTTQFDITNPTGDTHRYTWDGTGTAPEFISNGLLVSASLEINGQNFNAGNNLRATVTDLAETWFEITNAGGAAETDKTVGTGDIALRNRYAGWRLQNVTRGKQSWVTSSNDITQSLVCSPPITGQTIGDTYYLEKLENEIVLPRDFLQVDFLRWGDSASLEKISRNDIKRIETTGGSVSGTPMSYAIENNKIRLYPHPNTTDVLFLSYYAKPYYTTIGKTKTVSATSTTFGDTDTQFDITKSGAEVIYTYDATGTDPNFLTNGVSDGDSLVINAQNFDSSNNLTAVVHDVTDEVFKIYNMSGTAESNKTIGNGSIILANYHLLYLPDEFIYAFPSYRLEGASLLITDGTYEGEEVTIRDTSTTSSDGLKTYVYPEFTANIPAGTEFCTLVDIPTDFHSGLVHYMLWQYTKNKRGFEQMAQNSFGEWVDFVDSVEDRMIRRELPTQPKMGRSRGRSKPFPRITT